MIMAWHLVNDNTGAIAEIGDVVRTFRDEEVTLEGGFPPQHSNSSGRIVVSVQTVDGEEDYREFFPSVCNLRWVQETVIDLR